MKPITKNTSFPRWSKSPTSFHQRESTHLQTFLFSLLTEKFGDVLEDVGKERLQSYVDNAFEYYSISKEEHLKFRDEKSYNAEHSYFRMYGSDLPNKTYDSVAAMLIFNDESMDNLSNQLLYVCRRIWLNSLKQYEPFDLKTKLLDISSYWQETYQTNGFKLVEPVSIEGCVNLDCAVYFYIE
ncbi:hypothetical protein [Sporosarcina aquimarina]|uniref:hypothetical protein n=1 Tax=Sporosarcina aquimarina TaxID=114975 RepID=UPI001C8DCABB|nr:hypothetical protein [Sporosarcina aquimarina]MBY0221659.1 hypothetical protein [Sporosarcina aquimarina]